MSEQIMLQLAGVLILGIGMQWLAWRLRLPAILLLLASGLLIGPGSAWLAQHGVLAGQWLNPDKLFGELLLPAVSLAVALLLFEGGLTLNLAEHSAAKRVIWMLVTVGAGITFGVTACAAHGLLGLEWKPSILLGAILMVTGPTVIGPLLRHVRPEGVVGPILKWEGIIIDPIGAMAAVLVFEILVSGEVHLVPILREGLITVAAGSAFGLAGAAVIVVLFWRHWVPDFLHNAFALITVLAVFAASNALRHESGLFATTLMGVVLANQRRVSVHHVMEFKASLTVLLISGLFIILGARLSVEQLATIPWGRMGLFLLVLILVARPAAVFLCTSFSTLKWRERTFVALMAPRGIVAAAVASVFALRLSAQNFPGARMIVPVTFATIIGTVTVYGLTAAWIARRLGLARPGREGFLIAGAGLFERLLAAMLHAEGYPVLMVDTRRDQVAAARLTGVPVLHGSVLSQFVVDRTQLSAIARFMALTPNDEVNALAAVQYQRIFSRSDVFQLAPTHRTSARQERVSHDLRGRVLFGQDLTYGALEDRAEKGYTIKKTQLTADFGFDEYMKSKDEVAVPLMIKTELGEMVMFTAENPPKPRAGQTIYTLAPPKRAAS